MVKVCQILILVSLLLGVVWEGCAQDLARVDSLKRVLEGKRGNEKVEILGDLCALYADNDNIKGLMYAAEAYRVACVKPVDSAMFVKASRWCASFLRRLERYDTAIDLLQKALLVSKRNGYTIETAKLLNTLASAYSYTGDYTKAVSFNFESLQMKQREYDTAGISISLNNIGYIYYKLKDFNRALRYFNNSLAAKSSVGMNEYKASVLINIGLCCSNTGRYRDAIDYVNQGLSVKEDPHRQGLEIDGAMAFAMAYEGLGDYDLARYWFLHCYTLSKQDNNLYYQAESLSLLGRLLNNGGDYKLAGQYLDTCLEKALASQVKFSIANTYKQLFRSSKGRKHFEEASHYWDLYSQYYQDSLFDEDVARVIALAQVDIDQQQNQARLALQESTVQWQGHQNFWIALIGGLLIIAIELLIYDYAGRKRETQILETLVHDRTRALDQKVRVLERETTEGKAWQDKLDKSLREGYSRLTVLGELIGRDNIKTMLQQFRDLREGQPSE